MAACKALYGDEPAHQNRGAYVRRFPLQKGMSVLLDAFYRADVDVDGVLSITEFRSFLPSVANGDQMTTLFRELASNADATIHASEFCAFAVQHIGAFRDVLPALEELSGAVLRAADATLEEYDSSSFRDQFVTLLVARETLLQLTNAHAAIEGLCRSLEERQTKHNAVADSENEERRSSEKDGVASSSSSSAHSPVQEVNVTTKDLEHQMERLETLATQLQQLCQGNEAQGTGCGDSRVGAVGDQLDAIINKMHRLEALVDKLEEKVEFERVSEDTVDLSQESLLLIVQQKLEVDTAGAIEFKKSLDAYVQDTRITEGCTYVSVLSYQESPTFIVYEIWDSEDQWANISTPMHLAAVLLTRRLPRNLIPSKATRTVERREDTYRHVRSPVYKAFQHRNIEHLNKPEFFNTLQLPGNAFAQIGSSWARGQHSTPT